MMQGIDTNVLVRYLIKDDPEQFQQAVNLLKSIQIIYISPVVLVETVWVLSHCYQIKKERQCEQLAKVIQMRRFASDNKEATLLALSDYAKGYDFADAMIGHHNRYRCSRTWTFDKKAAKLEGFSLITIP